MDAVESLAIGTGVALPQRNDVYAAACPCRDLLDLLANKWSALAIGALEDGPKRFSQLKRTLDGISPKVLSANLKRLEDADLVLRTVYAEVPARVEYTLTDLGRSAAVPLMQLRTWATEHAQTPRDSEREEGPRRAAPDADGPTVEPGPSEDP